MMIYAAYANALIFDHFLHTLYGRGAPIEGILILCLRRGSILYPTTYTIGRWLWGDIWMSLRRPLKYQQVDYVIFIFRCTIITKYRMNLCYSPYVVIITYNLLFYDVYNRLASPDIPSLSSTAAHVLVLHHIIHFEQYLCKFLYKN